MHIALTQDEWFMKVAIAEAYKGKGSSLPNPAVGAVVVKNGKIISTGFHLKAGLPHAEAIALEKAGRNAKGATLYVTLEPCKHYGRTPPCTKKIINAGIKRVVIGTKDPNPKASGGVEELKNAGIEVKVGVLESECRELIDDFVHLLNSKFPFISLKLAATLDGNIADYEGNSKWITGEEARRYVHKLRSYHNAVMVGIGTVLKDNPLLNVRYVKTQTQPKAIVVDSSLKIPVHCRLVKERAKDLIIITSQKAMLTYKADILKDLGVELLPVFGNEGYLDLREGVGRLLEGKGIYSILCEGGSQLAKSLIGQKLISKMYLFYSPKLIGEGISLISSKLKLNEAITVYLKKVEFLQEDILLIMETRKSLDVG